MAHFRIVKPAVQDSVIIGMKDPNVKTEQEAGQPANSEAAQESASQDQATGAESAEEGGTEG